MQVDLSGKVAVVTGATRGLGWEIAAGLASNGADIIVSSRRQDACDKAAAKLSEMSGQRTLAHACHMGNWAQIGELVDASYTTFGKVDILVNNAGIAPVYPSLDNSPRNCSTRPSP